MTALLVFVNCQSIEDFRSKSSRMFEVWTKSSLSPQFASLHTDFMNPTSELVALRNSKVVYVSYDETDPSKPADVFEFAATCHPHVSNKSLFYVGSKPKTFEDLLAKCEDYGLISGDKISPQMSEVSRMFLRNHLIRAAHILYEWNARGLLKSKRIVKRSFGDVLIEHVVSQGDHRFLKKQEGFLFNTNTPVISTLIDFYDIRSSFGGPNVLLNFEKDVEYRLKVARMLFDVLRAFCLNNNPSTMPRAPENVDEVVRTLRVIFFSPVLGATVSEQAPMRGDAGAVITAPSCATSRAERGAIAPGSAPMRGERG